MYTELKRFTKALSSIDDSALFCSSGSLSTVIPGLEVESMGEVTVPVSAKEAKQLIKLSEQAPYGRGEDTILDTDIRRVWQIDATALSIQNPQWDDFLAGIVKTVKSDFAINRKVKADLYKLLVYEKGSFFAPHRDTEKLPGMFATLVVCLPSKHEGGTLLVTHDGNTETIEFGGKDNRFNIQFAAFYADCQHEVKPVTSGYRICLIYNLALVGRKQQPSAPKASKAADKLGKLIPGLFADGKRDKIAIPLAHRYTESELAPDKLKGADRSLFEVMNRVCNDTGYQAYLALYEHFQSGIPDYRTVEFRSYSRRRYWDDDFDNELDSAGAEFEDVFDEYRELTHWVDTNGKKQSFGTLGLADAELMSISPEDDFDYSQEVEEATGNAGASMERWYRGCVLVIWHPSRYFGILANEGQRLALPTLESMVARKRRKTDDCITFANEIVNRWEPGRRLTLSDTDPTPLTTRILKILDQLEMDDTASRFIQETLAAEYRGSEGRILASICNRIGWKAMAKPVASLFSPKVLETLQRSLTPTISLFEGLCASPPKMSAPRRDVLLPFADPIHRLSESSDSEVDTSNRYFNPDTRKGTVASVFRAYAALDATKQLDTFITYILAHTDLYDLRAVLVPDVKSLRRRVSAKSPARPQYERLLTHCKHELETLTATPPKPPADWTRDATIKCTCPDCKELAAFLLNPDEPVHEFSRRQDIRSHLESEIHYQKCDLDLKTTKRRSPHTLVCTKNLATHKRREAQFVQDVATLQELNKSE